MSDFPEEQLLVAVFPGVPTAAELFLLPHKNQSEGKKKSEEELVQVWPTFFAGFHMSLLLLEAYQIDSLILNKCLMQLLFKYKTQCCMWSTGIG